MNEEERNANEKRIAQIMESVHGIPKKCVCGGKIIRKNTKESTKTYFLCNVYENDGLHTHTPWDIAMEDEVETLQSKSSKHSAQILKLQLAVEQLSKALSDLKDMIAINNVTITKLFNKRMS